MASAHPGQFDDGDDDNDANGGVVPNVAAVATNTAGAAATTVDADKLCNEGLVLFDKEEYSRAHMLFAQATAMNHPEAMRMLGQCYYEGKGVAESLDNAILWWRTASQLGDQKSRYKIAELQYLGTEIPADYDEAFATFKDLAGMDDAWSQYHLANMYKDGQGTPKNEAEALKWMRMSAENGHEFAEHELMIMLDDFLPEGDEQSRQNIQLPPGAEDIEWE